MASIISRGGRALEVSDSDACRTGIVDIICMSTDVMWIIWEDYRLPYVHHRGGRSLAQSMVAQLPPIQGQWTSRGRCRYISRKPISLSDLTSLQPPTSLDSWLVQSPYLFIPNLFSPTFSTYYLFKPTFVPITPYVDPLSLHFDASLTTPLGSEFRTPSVIPPT